MRSTSIGDRLANLREFRDLTQEQLAERAGVHVDTIRKLEQNRRSSARINTLRALASALDVELERLLGQPTVTQEVPDEGGLLALRDAIQDVSTLPGVLADDLDEDPPSLDEWTDSVRAATNLYWQGRYSKLSGALPLILRDGRAVARDASGAVAERVWQQLALAYQLAASLTTQAGHTAWAFEAVAKQLEAAQRASDPLMEGMGVSTLSWVLLRQGRWTQAQQIAERKADALEPSFRRAKPAELAVYGNLLVAAATPAARQDKRDEANEMLNLAQAAATRSGPTRAYGTAFSPVDVQTQAVNIAMAGQDNEPAQALRLAAEVDLGAITRPVHRASHRLDVAQAQYQTGDGDGALTTLLDVEGGQPEWIKYQVLAVATVREMLEADRRRKSELRSLAARLGVDPTL
ncbi:helix-turn-helix domain-containing protein [Streptomyces silvisoli]|uniref:Helix-turn-helix transcriptional regulator n=1 Tax=Streptomyces silvisoli TaxID=3034235 RepID=A0ABT5ZQU5_9ACTN|nr:helix-turn-helix transcriptional regulator [Streptomyces silvisoli]MDF3292203.1 helix-turn-helix transcriptional regulator [Streptomyces silvisoli]